MSLISYIVDKQKRQRLWEFIKVSAAHHPHCEYYEKHVFELGGVKICRGCGVYYPTALLAFIGVWFIPHSFFAQSVLKLTFIGFIFVIPSLIHMSKIDEKLNIDRKLSLLSRFSFGLGIAYAVRYILVVPIVFKLIAIIGILSLYGLTMYSRYRNYWTECNGCPFEHERITYQHCPGLAKLNYFINPEAVKYFQMIESQREEKTV